MKKSLIVMVGFALVASVLAGTAGCGGGVSGKVSVSGSTTVQPIAQEAADQFMQENTGAQVTVQGGGSGVGVTNVSNGVSDIGDSSRELKDEENDLGLVDHKVALDIIAMIANKDVKVSNLTAAQAKDIFTGKITNWSEVGGSDAQIVVVVRDEASGTREMFDEKLLGSSKDNPVKPVNGAIETNSNGVMRQKVSATPDAIGYVSSGFVDESVTALKLDDVEPTLENALKETYPLSRYLHMFTKGEPTGATKSYIDFVLSEQFQNDVVSQDYIPIAEAQGASK